MYSDTYMKSRPVQQRLVPTSLDTGAIQEAIVAWLRLGWTPIPVRADNKRPLVTWRKRGSDRPLEEDQLLDLFRRFARQGVSIMVGIALPDDVVVLDVDHRPDSGWQATETAKTLGVNYGLPRQTPVSRTPSSGFHIWLSLPAGAKARNWTSAHKRFPIIGVDIRTSGGFVVVPPSVRTDGANYHWMARTEVLPVAPQSLVRDLCPPSAPLPRKPLSARSEFLEPYVQAAYASEIAAVRLSARGGRNDQLFRSAAALGSLIGAGVLPKDHVVHSLLLASEACGLLRDDAQRSVMATIESGITRGLEHPRLIEGVER